MKIKLTICGCGWLGLPLAKALSTTFELKGTVRNIEKKKRLLAENIEPFLFDLQKGKQNFSFLNSEILILALPPQTLPNYKKFIKAIENSTVQKLIFISSISVYQNENKLVTEDSPLNNSLLTSAEGLFRANENFESIIIRFGGLFGVNRKPQNFYPTGRLIPNPLGYVNMIHQADCIQIITQLIAQNCWGKTYNACADMHPTRKEFYTHYARKSKEKAPKFGLEKEKSKIVSSQKLKLAIGYHFLYPNLLADL